VDGAEACEWRLLLDGRKSAKEETADVGEGGGATGRDGSCGEVNVQVCQGVVDAMNTAEAVSTVDERADAIIRVALAFGVVRAIPGIRVDKE
jgi:hypothetical protein